MDDEALEDILADVERLIAEIEAHPMFGVPAHPGGEVAAAAEHVIVDADRTMTSSIRRAVEDGRRRADDAGSLDRARAMRSSLSGELRRLDRRRSPPGAGL